VQQELHPCSPSHPHVPLRARWARNATHPRPMVEDARPSPEARAFDRCMNPQGFLHNSPFSPCFVAALLTGPSRALALVGLALAQVLMFHELQPFAKPLNKRMSSEHRSAAFTLLLRPDQPGEPHYSHIVKQISCGRRSVPGRRLSPSTAGSGNSRMVGRVESGRNGPSRVTVQPKPRNAL
jgi:hypothetical protein